ncbi:mandelate racemase/muconate lactonizing enzyme family protein [Roseibacterium beibuensis]|uniref:Mandelate racemase/muconate lactonizing enzyme family protein n=1 Tax=[Roseibacterium] beibuensis TaxID=1193142 RepID=A0ABP9LIG2_9RHOB|nr:mandelate racemase/muconate lactonizing enzyme family protein [Roseibacterium beibuensis]MCS6625817.1 mandelate racemase/muconate lactonizing enzyme family protein [Roseibacterium beibuensis]
MRLTDLEIFPVAPPPPGWGGRYWLILRLTTADGITGLGEVYASAVGPKAMAAVIEDVFARHMEGNAPENIETMFRRAYSSGFTQRPDPTVMGAFSGLEMACWDILGKMRDRPVWALMGGRMNDRLRAYTYLYPEPHHDPDRFWIDADMAAEAASARVAEGWTAVKFDPAGPYTMRGGHMPAMSDITRSAAFCAAIRAAVGDRADLLFGTHGQFTPAGAIRLAQAIAPHDPLWFEEPVPPDDFPALAAVARATTIPVATGERLTTKAEFAAALAHGARILQPALGRAGGLWEGKKIATLAEAAGAQLAPHLYAGPVEWAANVHLGVTCPNLLMVEAIESPFHDALVTGRPRVENGFVAAPDAPGLGIALNEDLARAHPVTTDRLHLEMRDAPCDWQNGNAFAGGAAD